MSEASRSPRPRAASRIGRVAITTLTVEPAPEPEPELFGELEWESESQLEFVVGRSHVQFDGIPLAPPSIPPVGTPTPVTVRPPASALQLGAGRVERGDRCARGWRGWPPAGSGGDRGGRLARDRALRPVEEHSAPAAPGVALARAARGPAGRSASRPAIGRSARAGESRLRWRSAEAAAGDARPGLHASADERTGVLRTRPPGARRSDAAADRLHARGEPHACSGAGAVRGVRRQADRRRRPGERSLRRLQGAHRRGAWPGAPILPAPADAAPPVGAHPHRAEHGGRGPAHADTAPQAAARAPGLARARSARSCLDAARRARAGGNGLRGALVPPGAAGSGRPPARRRRDHPPPEEEARRPGEAPRGAGGPARGVEGASRAASGAGPARLGPSRSRPGTPRRPTSRPRRRWRPRCSRRAGTSMRSGFGWRPSPGGADSSSPPPSWPR